MITDDVLADLGEQLRTARPRRDPRPLAGLALLAAVALAVLALVPRERERPAPAAPVNQPRVAVLNGTVVPGLAEQTAAALRRAGYRVLPIANAPDQATRHTTVAAAPRFAEAARALRQRLDARPAPGVRKGWTGYAPLVPDADVVVVLGRDAAPRALVLDASGSGGRAAARLRARGVVVTRVEPFPAGRFHTALESIGADTAPARVVAAALDPPGPVKITPTFGSGEPADVVVYAGADLTGAAGLERRLPASSCRTEGRAYYFRCVVAGGAAYSVRWRRNGCWAAKLVRGRGAPERSGCGARP